MPSGTVTRFATKIFLLFGIAFIQDSAIDDSVYPSVLDDWNFIASIQVGSVMFVVLGRP